MKEYNSIKKKILQSIDPNKREIIEVNDLIHSFAEYGTMEYKSSELLKTRLKEIDFKIESPEIELGTSTSASIKIGEGFRGHTPEFANAAASEEGHKAAIIGAKAMALLTAKLFIDPSLVREAKKYFTQNINQI